MTAEIPLGRATTYPEHYSPGLLYAIARTDSRAALGLGDDLPFQGADIWNAWELTWLDKAGLPQVATAEISIPAASPSIIESKSLKLYLGSFAMTQFGSDAAVAAPISRDISVCVGTGVDVRLRRLSSIDGAVIAQLPGDCIDSMTVSCATYEVDPELLRADASDFVSETIHSHLLRSLCPVTNQPDMGSVIFSYEGPRIDRERLLRYVVSYRQHHDFHEACVERMFVEILERCRPEKLSVYARYQRRGGIDINPFRSNYETDPPNIRLWRQ
ncbi:MAG: NADPH-dependent 7-cyano-7-deazaguanine reductase QueF [Gammaproteobacteria bacterium]|nr:NADPH-dependent 7-cyano-7-deazaguanine reductase QueF [Gammaproteobacteria bacterium]